MRPASPLAETPLSPAQQELVNSCIALAYAWAERYGWDLDWLPWEDRLSEAFDALVRAAQYYDPDYRVGGKPVKFCTYAGNGIRNRFRSLRWERANRPKAPQKWECRWADAERDYHEPADLRHAPDLLAVHDELKACRKLCTRREWRLLCLRYGQGLGLREMALKLGISKERVRQIVAGAIRKVRAARGG